MNWVNLIMCGSFYLVLPILYAVMRNCCVEKNHLILSVTVPPGAGEDAQVQEVCRRFRRRLAAVLWGLTLVLVPVLFLPWVSVMTMICCVWMIAAIVLPYCAFGKANGEMKAIKKARGWRSGFAGQTVAELPPARPPKRLRSGWFVPPMIVSLLPLLSVFLDDWDAAWNTVLAVTAGTCFLMTVLSLVFYPLVFRQRLDALDEDTELTAALTRVRRYNWTKFWLLSAWCTAAYSVAVWCCQGNMAWYFIWTLVYGAVLTAASLQTEFAARRAQRALTAGREQAALVDEDDCWIWGLFYCNPNNNRLFVSERVGMGLAMNLARPAARIFMGVSALILLLIPLLGVWLMVEEFSPIGLKLEEETIVSTQAFTTYRVELDEVEHAELLETLPAASRIAGTAMEHLLKGRFTLDGYGAVRICADPQTPPFLVLETEDVTYCFGGGNAEKLYDVLAQ